MHLQGRIARPHGLSQRRSTDVPVVGITRGVVVHDRKPCAPGRHLLTARHVAAPERPVQVSGPDDKHRKAAQEPIASPEPGFRTLLDMWPYLAAHHGQRLALKEPHNAEATDMNYEQLHGVIQQAAAGLQQLGLRQGDRVALIAESSSRWVAADQAAMLAGGCTAVRGSACPPEEVAYITGHASCMGLIVQDAQALRNLLPHLSKPGLPVLKFIVLIWGSADSTTRAQVEQHAAAQRQHDSSIVAPQLLSWSELLARGQAALQGRGGAGDGAAPGWQPVQVDPHSLATMVYTSGTSGHPKGVMLTHANLVYQVNHLRYFVDVRPGDVCLSLLPPWHIYQRTCSYYIHASGGAMIFTTIRRFKDDLAAYPPDHLVCVPLVLDTLYTRVMSRLAAASAVRRTLANTFIGISTAYVHARRVVEGVALQYAVQKPGLLAMLRAMLVAAFLAPLHKLGAKLVYSKVREALAVRKTIISGGGSLATHLDTFFEILDLPVCNGWGLTETSPVIACRRTAQNVRGTVGLPVPGTEVRVVDPETLAPCTQPGARGLLLARGPGVMRGYLRDDAASAKAFRAGDGWFDTGDLGWIVPEGSKMSGMVVLTGRAKDTIVLLSGKNIEPQPVEDAICASPLIKHALLLGQDKRELGLVIFPDMDALEAALATQAATTSAPTSSNGNGSSAAAAPAAVQGKGLGAGAHPLVQAASPSTLRALLLPEVTRLNSARHDYTGEQHIHHITVITRGQLSPEDGTLTRTMKLRRAEVCKLYAADVDALLARLRSSH